MLPSCLDLMRFIHVHSENYNFTHTQRHRKITGLYLSGWLLKITLWKKFRKSHISKRHME